jgi:hypothetical protein
VDSVQEQMEQIKMIFNMEMMASCMQKVLDVTQSRIFYIYDSVFVSEGQTSAGWFLRTF